MGTSYRPMLRLAQGLSLPSLTDFQRSLWQSSSQSKYQNSSIASSAHRQSGDTLVPPLRPRSPKTRNCLRQRQKRWKLPTLCALYKTKEAVDKVELAGLKQL